MTNRDKTLLPSVVEAIGHTPLIELTRLTRDLEGRIFVKLDMLNPGGSKKDRIARQVIEDAEAAGDLKPGQSIVEHTSGNTGTGLAIVAAVKGYKFTAILSAGNSKERVIMMEALGAEVIVVPQAPGSKPGQVSGEDWQLVEEATLKIVAERNGFLVSQFTARGNFRAHYLGTGPEIIAQSAEAGGINAFCDFVGSGGTFAGTAAALKEHDPSIKCYVVEPEGAAVLAGRDITNPHHPFQGGGYSKTDLAQMEMEHGGGKLVDGTIQVASAEGLELVRRLAKEEGIFAGPSSGANLAAAFQLLRGEMRGQTVATIINDSGLKYMSTDLWN